MGVYADLSQDEYRSKALGYNAHLHKKRPLRAAPFLYKGTVPPEEVDWVAGGAVTPVRGQEGIGRGCAGLAGIGIYRGAARLRWSVHCISQMGRAPLPTSIDISPVGSYLPRYLPAGLHLVLLCAYR